MQDWDLSPLIQYIGIYGMDLFWCSTGSLCHSIWWSLVRLQSQFYTSGCHRGQKLCHILWNRSFTAEVNTVDKREFTWLPSFCQKTAGGGFPLVPQRNVTVRPGAVIWPRGRTTIWGGTDTGEKRKVIIKVQMRWISVVVLCSLCV